MNKRAKIINDPIWIKPTKTLLVLKKIKALYQVYKQRKWPLYEKVFIENKSNNKMKLKNIIQQNEHKKPLALNFQKIQKQNCKMIYKISKKLEII